MSCKVKRILRKWVNSKSECPLRGGVQKSFEGRKRAQNGQLNFFGQQQSR